LDAIARFVLDGGVLTQVVRQGPGEAMVLSECARNERCLEPAESEGLNATHRSNRARWGLVLAIAALGAGGADAVRGELPERCLDATGAVIPESVVPDTKTWRQAKKSEIKSPKRVYSPQPIWPKDVICKTNRRDFKFQFIIRTDGYVCGVESLSYVPETCQAHIDAVVYRLAAWKFEPATLAGKPVAVRYVLRLRLR
jgi:hypothetical protein